MISSKVCSEIHAVIITLGGRYLASIPQNFMDFIAAERDINYKPFIDKDKELHKQGLAEETISMIAFLKLEFWCRTDEEKNALLSLLESNEQKLNEQLSQTTSTSELLRLLKNRK